MTLTINPSAAPPIQSTIRSFFSPRSASYTTPPSSQLPFVKQSAATRTARSPAFSPPPPPPPAQGSATSRQAPAITTPSEAHSPPAASSSSAAVPSTGAAIVPVSSEHVTPLRHLNGLLLPVIYPDSFYTRITTPHELFSTTFSRCVLWTDSPTAEAKLIGGLVVRVDSALDAADHHHLYIQSLALRSPYRGQGLASRMLDAVLDAVRDQAQDTTSNPVVDSLYAHVWTENEEALEWYAKRGFVKEGAMVQGYYRKLQPDTAWVLRRAITPTDLLPRGTPEAIVSPTTFKPAPKSVQMRPKLGVHAASYQDRRPDTEWNDLTEDILSPGGSNVAAMLRVPSADTSRASSRSSSRSAVNGKKRRAYPAAAFDVTSPM